VGADFRALAKTKISDIARGESKTHLSQSTMPKASSGMSSLKNIVPFALLSMMYVQTFSCIVFHL